MSGPKTVFLSYVADTKTFVDAFCDGLFDVSGRLRRIDWQIDNVDPGKDIYADIFEKIDTADIVISFICKKYCSRMGADELRRAVRRRRQGDSRPILVPITLGITGRSWWKLFKEDALEEATLRNIADKQFFTPGTDQWFLPRAEDLQAIHALRDWLCQSEVGRPDPKPGSVERIVLLGHPTRSLPESVGRAAGQVADALTEAGVPVAHWLDGWEGAAPEDPAAGKPAVFLQPLAPADAAANARTPSRTANYLANALGDAARPRIEASPVVLWLPDGERDTAFERDAKGKAEANPAFRTDAAPALAEWLCHRFGFGQRGPVMACEEIEVRSEDRSRLFDARRQLAEEIDEIAEIVLPPPEDRLSVWFTANQFEHYFRSVADKRPILMAHDLKMPIPAMQGAAKPVQQLIGKFRAMQAKADQILREMGRTPDDVFWIACITLGPEVVPPSVRLPNPSVDRWLMLRVEQHDTQLVLEPESRNCIRDELKSWAARQRV